MSAADAMDFGDALRILRAAKLFDRQQDRHVLADCPLCGQQMRVDSLSNGSAAFRCYAGTPEPEIVSELLRLAPAELAGGVGLRVRPVSSVKARPVRYLSRRLGLPLGKLTVGAGLPGAGKSTFFGGVLAALVTRGRAGGDLPGPADVLVISAEDDPEDTLKPRLMAAGADLDRVHLVDLREEGPDGQPIPGLVQLPAHAALIGDAVRRVGARLVVLDPVVALLDSEHSAYKEQDVRAALAPLKAMAEETGAAVVVVMHLNKAEGSDPLRRIANSAAFTALARSVLLLGSDPEDEDGDRRVLVNVKSNVSATGKGTGVALRLVATTVLGDEGEVINTSTLEEVGSSEVSAESLLGERDDRTALGAAMAWLRDLLADGPVPATDVKREAEGQGHAWRTVRRAKNDLGVETEKVTGVARGSWLWRLPSGSDPGQADDPPPLSPEHGHLGHLSSVETETVANFQGGQYPHGQLPQGGQADQPIPLSRGKVAKGDKAPRAGAREAAEPRLLTEDELVQRLKAEFGALEVA